MKKLFVLVVLNAALAGVSFAEVPSTPVKAAVVEFTPGPNASGMTHEGKRHLQAHIASLLHKARIFHIVDVRHTREASQSILAAVNSGNSTEAAVRVGKQLGVSYVLTGHVVEYAPNGGGGFGQATIRTRLVEVATGKVRHSEEIVQVGTSAMRTTGTDEMHSKVLKPAIDKLVATLGAKF